MTVKELKDKLAYYDDDSEVIFEIDDKIEPEEVIENKYGWWSMHLRSKLKPTFIGNIRGECYIELGVEDDGHE